MAPVCHANSIFSTTIWKDFLVIPTIDPKPACSRPEHLATFADNPDDCCYHPDSSHESGIA